MNKENKWYKELQKVGTRPQAGAKIKIVSGTNKNTMILRKLDDSQDNVTKPNKGGTKQEKSITPQVISTRKLVNKRDINGT